MGVIKSRTIEQCTALYLSISMVFLVAPYERAPKGKAPERESKTTPIHM